MLSKIFGFLVDQAELTEGSLSFEYRTLLLSIVLLSFVWIVWRIWTFTIIPRLRPREPPFLPYSLPLIGHTISFFQSQEKLLQRGSKYFPIDVPFALFIGGCKFVILRNPPDVRRIWNETKALSFDDYLRSVFDGFGVPSTHYSVVFDDNPGRLWQGDEKNIPHFVKDNSAKKRFVNLQEGWMKEALQPGTKMDTVSQIFLDQIDRLLPKYLSDPRVIQHSDTRGKTVSLYNWGRYVLSEAGSTAFLGKEIFDIDPDFVQHYTEWENLSWKIPYQHPSILSRDMQKAREKVVQSLTKYYSLNPSQRPNLSWLFDRMQSEQQKLGLSLHDTGTIALMMLWGVHLNTYRMLFWTLTHILSSPSLTATITSETASAFDTTTDRFDISYLTDKCSVLTATWNEVLRLYASSAVIRTCVSPTVIGNKTIYPGDRVLGPFRLMHHSTSIWGADALNFDEQRWLRNGGLKSPKGFHPFGGGHMHCPGRTLAKQEVCLFVATVLRKYEIEPLGVRIDGGEGWEVPVVSDDHVLASLDPKEDFLVRVREKL